MVRSTPQPEWLRIDLLAVSFMDTTGVAVLLKARRRALEAGCRFTVKAASPTIQRLLEITGLAALLARMSPHGVVVESVNVSVLL